MDSLFKDKSVAARTRMSDIFTSYSPHSSQQQEEGEVQNNDKKSSSPSEGGGGGGDVDEGSSSSSRRQRISDDRRALVQSIPTLKILGKMLRSINASPEGGGGGGGRGDGDGDGGSGGDGDSGRGVGSPRSPVAVSSSQTDPDLIPADAILHGGQGGRGGIPVVDELDGGAPLITGSGDDSMKKRKDDVSAEVSVDVETEAQGGYVHGMTDSLEQELNEFLSQVELPLLDRCRRSFQEIVEKETRGQNWDEETLHDLVEQWIDIVDSCADPVRQVHFGGALLHFAMGAGNIHATPEEHIQSIQTNGKLLFECGGLPIFMKAFKLHVQHLLKETDDVPYMNPDVEEDHMLIDRVNLFANLFYFVMCSATDNCTNRIDEIVTLVFDGDTHDDNFVQYLINLLSELFLFEEGNSARGHLLPMKKLVCLLWKCLLLILGRTESSNESFQPGPNMVLKINENELQERDVLWQRQVHSQRGIDVDTVAEMIDSSYDSAGYPKSLKEALRILHTTQISDRSYSSESDALLSNMASGNNMSAGQFPHQQLLQQQQQQQKDPILDADFTKDLPRSLQRNPPNVELLYQQLLPQMPDFVLLLLRLFLGVTEHCFSGYGSNALAGSGPTFNDVPVLHHQMVLHSGSALCFRRLCQVIFKSTIAITHLLLKHFKANHIMQYLHFSSLLCDGNSVILLLNYLNQNGMSEYVSSIEPVDKRETNFLRQAALLATGLVDPFSPPVTPKTPSAMTASPSGENETEFRYNWRNMYSLITATRILQKLTKNNPLAIRAMLDAKAPRIMKKSLLAVEQRLFRLYALKVMKSFVRFMDAKWRNSNLKIINMIHSMTRPTLVDPWLMSIVPVGARGSSGVHKYLGGPQAIERDEKIRERVSEFNQYHYERWWEYMNSQPLMTDLTTHGDKMLFLPEHNFLAISRLQSLYNSMPEPTMDEVRQFLLTAYPSDRYPLFPPSG